MNKKILLFVILLIFFIALLLGLGDQFNLSNIQSSLDNIRNWRAENGFIFILGFMLIYIAFVALSLPFATFLTLLAGAIFGFWQGILVTTISATIGATIAFLLARFFFQDWVQTRFSSQLKPINEGFEKQGKFYLFSLRVVPLFPFFLINLVMGLTPIRTKDYALISFLGMLPGSMVYVFAGRNLGQLESLSGILSLPIILSFTLLGLFPWIARFALGWLTARKVYKDYDRPKSYDRNLIVIGAGAAGLVGAYMGANLKAKVTLVEAGKMGGDCLNTGCIPSKALIKSAKIARQMRHADQYGLKPHEAEFELADLMKRVRNSIETIEPHDSVERYEGLGVDVALGRAEILDPWRVKISPHQGEPYTLSTRSILIATGASPFIPPIEGLDQLDYLTSENLWERLEAMKNLPKRLMVLGGGVIGIELAQAFARLGVKVSLVEMDHKLLGREDEDASEYALHALEADGVELFLEHKAVKFSQKTASLEHKGQRKEVKFDALLVAVGRKASLEGYGLEALNVEHKNTITTNSSLQTNYPNIYAAGDVAGPYQLTHMAGHQGAYAAINALLNGLWRFKLNYDQVPMAIFTDPEIARIGLNETEAKANGVDYDVTHYDLAKLDRAIAEGSNKGFVKILTRKGTDKILGVSAVGDHAGEIIGEYGLAMRHKIGLRKILGTLHAYPTWSDAVRNGASTWQNARSNPRLMRLLNWFMEKQRK